MLKTEFEIKLMAFIRAETGLTVIRGEENKDGITIFTEVVEYGPNDSYTEHTIFFIYQRKETSELPKDADDKAEALYRRFTKNPSFQHLNEHLGVVVTPLSSYSSVVDPDTRILSAFWKLKFWIR